MNESQLLFDQRVRGLLRKHRALARGYTHRMRPDGLIVLKPRRAQARISGRSVAIFLMAFFLFKGFLIANLGEQTYLDRVVQLQKGTVVERAGSVLMQNDPLSRLIALKIGPVLR